MINTRQISFWHRLVNTQESSDTMQKQPVPFHYLQWVGSVDTHAKTWVVQKPDLTLSKLRSIDHKVKLDLVPWSRAWGLILLIRKMHNREDGLLELRVCSCEKGRKISKRDKGGDNEHSMQSSCWEPKELSRVLAWKNRKGNSKRYHLQGPNHMRKSRQREWGKRAEDMESFWAITFPSSVSRLGLQLLSELSFCRIL